ncbi:hypothetical protein A5695_14285 [Mycobacterium sp. E1747]|nr:hypothetical protein A5695_14285 [Mycobacterium sp. E1747]
MLCRVATSGLYGSPLPRYMSWFAGLREQRFQGGGVFFDLVEVDTTQSVCGNTELLGSRGFPFPYLLSRFQRTQRAFSSVSPFDGLLKLSLLRLLQVS